MLEEAILLDAGFRLQYWSGFRIPKPRALNSEFADDSVVQYSSRVGEQPEKMLLGWTVCGGACCVIQAVGREREASARAEINGPLKVKSF